MRRSPSRNLPKGGRIRQTARSAQTVDGRSGSVDKEHGRSPVRDRRLQELLTRIEAAKRYPPTARRRRLEGGVPVSFRVGNEGEVRGLVVDARHGVLARAARNAIREAAPLPPLPAELRPSLSVRYRMRFRLR